MSQNEKDAKVAKSIQILARQAQKQAKRNDVADVDFINNQIVISYAQGNKKSIPLSSIALDSAPSNFFQREITKDGKDNTKDFLENFKLFAELNAAIKNGLGFNAQNIQHAAPLPSSVLSSASHQQSFNNDSAINRDAEVVIQKGQDGQNGKDGRGVKSTKIKNGDLIVTYTDGTEDNAGSLEKLVEKLVEKMPTKNIVQLVGGGGGGSGGNSGGGGTTPAPIQVEITGDITGQGTQVGNKVTIDTTLVAEDLGNITHDQITDWNTAWYNAFVQFPASLLQPATSPINGGYQDHGNIHNLTAVNIWGDRVRGAFSSLSDSLYASSASDGIVAFRFNEGQVNEASNFIEFRQNNQNGPVLFNNSGRTIKVRVDAAVRILRGTGTSPIDLTFYFGKGYDDSSGNYFTPIIDSNLDVKFLVSDQVISVRHSYLLALVPGECVNLMYKCKNIGTGSDNAFKAVNLSLIAEQ